MTSPETQYALVVALTVGGVLFGSAVCFLVWYCIDKWMSAKRRHAIIRGLEREGYPWV